MDGHPTKKRLGLGMAVSPATFLVVGALLAGAARAEDPPLHERIDALVEATAPGPRTGAAPDADFLRRAYLDLNGTIPDAATARVFLDDADPNKRAALVDRLLAAPRFARHMQHTFDVMWMERRADTNIPQAEWQEYLRKSFEAGKPLDQLAREVLGADGADPALRPAARFYLDRQGDSNLLARDVGRLFFGRDLQCAQCHDHPIVDDYLQSEYYGLMAFVSRGTLFVDAKEKKTYYAELAEGEVNFKSVFTGNAREGVLPELPQGTPVSEPKLAAGEQYVVAPDKDKTVRPVPKYSRRAQLAAQATCGTSAAFNRNLANRLWAHMMGRGLVHPADMQHSGNPPVQSELLTLVSNELVRSKFDLRWFLRELALSRTYQRSSEEPPPAEAKIDPGELSPKLAAWKAEAEKLSAELPALEQASAAALTAAGAAYEKVAAAVAARAAAEKVHGEAKKASDDLSAALAVAIKEGETKADALKVVIAARVGADAAVAKLPGDKPLADAAALYQQRANEIDTQLAAARAAVAEKTPQVQAASLKLAETDKVLQAALAAATQVTAELATADTASRETAERFRVAAATSAELAARIADADAAIEFDRLRTAAAADPAPMQTSWTKVVERANARFTLAALKPLSPEQLAWATMQAVGVVEAQRVALEPEATKAAEAGKLPVDRVLEASIDEKLRGNVPPFVSLFGQQPGQAATFQSTVHQALFLSNGGLLAGWLNPGGNNLTERLAKLEDPQALADELYLSVLTRRPTPDEVAKVGDYWKAAAADRAAAAREMVWSLVASAEFRFNR